MKIGNKVRKYSITEKKIAVRIDSTVQLTAMFSRFKRSFSNPSISLTEIISGTRK